MKQECLNLRGAYFPMINRLSQHNGYFKVTSVYKPDVNPSRGKDALMYPTGCSLLILT